MPTVSGLCRVIGQIARFFFCKRRIGRSPTRGVCRASLQVSLPSAEVPHPHAQPSEWTSLDPEGQNESVFISPVIESSTSTSPAAVCDSWCRLQMVFLILGIGLQAAALPLLLLLLNAPQIHFVSPYVQKKKKKKGCTDAGWLAGWLSSPPTQTFMTRCL